MGMPRQGWYQPILDAYEARPQPREGFWRARCPAHDGKGRNLSIWLTPTGNLWLRCYSHGCTIKEIIAARGLKMGDLFAPENKQAQGYGPYDRDTGGKRRASPEVTRKVEAEYIYQDEEGKILFKTIRWRLSDGSKSFSASRYDPEYRHSKGGWATGIGDCRRVLYHLPQLVAAKLEQPIVLVEGEGKVEAVEAHLGLVATCNPFGAAQLHHGEKWRDEYSRCLTGRRVVILPDNDMAGFEHADRIMGTLLRHNVASLRVVELPGLPQKGDVVDWIANGGTRQQFVDTVLAHKEWKS